MVTDNVTLHGLPPNLTQVTRTLCLSLPAFIYSKLTIETLEQGVTVDFEHVIAGWYKSKDLRMVWSSNLHQISYNKE